MALWAGKKNLRGMGIIGPADPHVSFDYDHLSLDNGASALCGKRSPIWWYRAMPSDSSFKCRQCLKAQKAL